MNPDPLLTLKRIWSILVWETTVDFGLINGIDGLYKTEIWCGGNLFKSIKQAYRKEINNVFEQLNKLGSYIDRAAMRPRKLTNTIKHSASALQSLAHHHHIHVIDRLKQHLNDNYSGIEMIIDVASATIRPSIPVSKEVGFTPLHVCPLWRANLD
jgi:hypothetical protein